MAYIGRIYQRKGKSMKKLAKQLLSLMLSLIMVLSIAPFGSLTGIATEAKAAGVNHYNGIVAAK